MFEVFLVPEDVVERLDLELVADGFLVLADANETPATGTRVGGGTLDLFVLPALSMSVSLGGTLPPLILPAAALAISLFLLASFALSVVCLLPAFAMVPGGLILVFSCASLTSPRLGIVELVAVATNCLTSVGGRNPDGFFTVYPFCQLCPCAHALFTLRKCSGATYRRLQIVHDAQRYNDRAI